MTVTPIKHNCWAGHPTLSVLIGNIQKWVGKALKTTISPKKGLLKGLPANLMIAQLRDKTVFLWSRAANIKKLVPAKPSAKQVLKMAQLRDGIKVAQFGNLRRPGN